MDRTIKFNKAFCRQDCCSVEAAEASANKQPLHDFV